MSKKDEDFFWSLVEQFLDKANEACEETDPNIVSAALLNAAARFNAFVVAHESLDKDEYAEEVDSALNYLTNRYRELAKEHLDDYRENYDQYVGPKNQEA
jgi:hypothetical protein